MDVSGQLQASTALLKDKSAPLHIDQDGVFFPVLLDVLDNRKIFYLCRKSNHDALVVQPGYYIN